MSLQQHSWKSEVETTWISLIGWDHNTSNKYTHNVMTLNENDANIKSMPIPVVEFPSEGFKIKKFALNEILRLFLT